MILSSASYSISKKLYLVGLGLLALALPLSVFLMSVAQFVIAAAWLLEGNYKSRLNNFLSNKSAVFFVSIYFLHLVGLLWTIDFNYALNDLRIKLPLLVLPLIVASSPPLKPNEIKGLLRVFVFAVFAGTIANFVIAQGYFIEQQTYRHSAFISHIRFSLMIVFSVFFLAKELPQTKRLPMKVLAIVLIFWLTFFLFYLMALTGVIAFLFGLFLSLVLLLLRGRSFRKKMLFLGLILTGVLVVGGYGYFQIHSFYQLKNDKPINYNERSALGNAYEHHPGNPMIENGYYTWRYVAQDELKESWNKRSEIKYWDKDKKRQPLYATLIRFLTSKGLRKDAAAVSELSEKEVEAIENGTTNVRFMDGKSFNDRVYELIWEYHNYKHFSYASGSSVFQRIEYWKLGWEIFLNHKVLGVGTGDVKSAFDEAYQQSQKLKSEFRHRAHNQYLTMLITFGVIGFVWFMLAMVFPLVNQAESLSYLALIAVVIVAISMVTEDMLETQAGVTFVTFLYCLFFFAGINNPKPR